MRQRSTSRQPQGHAEKDAAVRNSRPHRPLFHDRVVGNVGKYGDHEARLISGERSDQTRHNGDTPRPGCLFEEDTPDEEDVLDEKSSNDEQHGQLSTIFVTPGTNQEDKDHGKGILEKGTIHHDAAD